MRPEHVAGREYHAVVHAAPGDIGRIQLLGQAAPQIEAAARHRPWNHAEVCQAIDRPVA